MCLYSECVCVCVSVFLPKLSGRQIASFLRRIIFSFVICLVLHYFCTLRHKRHDFRIKSVTEQKIDILISLQLLSATFPALRRIQRHINTKFTYKVRPKSQDDVNCFFSTQNV